MARLTRGQLLGAAAAGAGAGIYLTTRGAESLVQSSVDQVADRAQAVMREEGIVPDASSTEDSGDERELKGRLALGAIDDANVVSAYVAIRKANGEMPRSLVAVSQWSLVIGLLLVAALELELVWGC